jgi:hypothetical protein
MDPGLLPWDSYLGRAIPLVLLAFLEGGPHPLAKGSGSRSRHL